MLFLKKITQNIWLFIVLLFIKLRTKLSRDENKNKSLLIIKVDAIGDYIIFRSFIETIRKSKKYEGYKITLLGNSLWKDIAIGLDSNYIDAFIWIDAVAYRKYHYKKSFLRMLASKKFSESIVFHYSRTVFTEILAFAVTTNELNGISNDYSHLSPKFRAISDKLYSTLYFIPEEHKHEFFKLRFFVSQLIETNIDALPLKPIITLTKSNTLLSRFGITKPFILINCGAGDAKRKLPIKKMKSGVEVLLEADTLICFTGTKADKHYADTLIVDFPEKNSNFKNIAGETTLMEVLHLINDAKFVVCNESSTYHMAIGLNKEVFCFSGGGHFERFAHYPNINTNLLFHKMPCFNCNWNCIYPADAEKAYPCIEAIEIDKLKKMLAYSLLSKN